jgi:putative flippase GtrA
VAVTVNRAVQALKDRETRVQVVKFGVVGGGGFVINLVAYRLLIGIGPHPAAAISFVVGSASNYWWNRHWTFVKHKGHFGRQGAKSFVVSLVALGINQAWLYLFFDRLHFGKISAEVLSIALIVPVNFLGNKLWAFRR